MSTRSTRWSPTPEQLVILQELYRRGLRNPSASHIQKITAQLSLYGKIQGKSVFYWFQNHKARDRLKLRKNLLTKQVLHEQQLLQQHLNAQYHLHDNKNLYSACYQLFNTYSAQNFYPQGTGSCAEAAPEGMVKLTWRPHCLTGTYGQDSMMAMDVGPIFPCWPRNRPLETLELFPLRSTSKESTTAN